MAFATKLSLAGLLVLGCLAINTDGADVVPKCPGRYYSGKIEYPPNCMLYVECFYGQGTVESCPHTTVFKPSVGDCVLQKDYPQCEDGGFIDFAFRKKHPA